MISGARVSIVVGFALEDDKFPRLARSYALIDKPIRFIDTAAPASFPVAKGFRLADAGVAVALNVLYELVDSFEGLFVLDLPARVLVPCAGREIDDHVRFGSYASISSRRWASPRSKERMESARMRWFASEKKGSGLSERTSKGSLRRRIIWRRKSLTPLEMSRPALFSSDSASRRKSESIRICSVDVAILVSFVVHMNDIIAHIMFVCKEGC